jgi:hypothetical protein
VGLGEARGCGCNSGGGSARRSSPACTRVCCSGHRKERKRGRTCAWCKGKPKQGDEAVVQCCRELATAEQRRQSTGVRVLAARVGYGLPDLAQQDGEGALVLTEGSNWPGKQRSVADGEVRAAGRRGARGGIRCRASPGF